MIVRKTALWWGALTLCFVFCRTVHADTPIGMDSSGFGVVPGTNMTTGMPPMDQTTRPSPPSTMPNALLPLAPSGPPPVLPNGTAIVPPTPPGQAPAGMMAPAPVLNPPPPMPLQDASPSSN